MEKMVLNVGDKFAYRDENNKNIKYAVDITDINTCDLFICLNNIIMCACESRVNVSTGQIDKAKMIQSSVFIANDKKVPNFEIIKTHYYQEDDVMLEIYKKLNIQSMGNSGNNDFLTYRNMDSNRDTSKYVYLDKYRGYVYMNLFGKYVCDIE